MSARPRSWKSRWVRGVARGFCPGWSLLPDGHLDLGVAGGAVGLRRLLHAGLRVARLVGGPGLDEVGARRGVPVPDPLPPGVDARHGGQLGLLPWAVVHLDVHRVDAAM